MAVWPCRCVVPCDPCPFGALINWSFKKKQKEIVTMIIKTKVLGGGNVVVVVVCIWTQPLLRKLEAAGEADMEVLVVVRGRSRSIL